MYILYPPVCRAPETALKDRAGKEGKNNGVLIPRAMPWAIFYAALSQGYQRRKMSDIMKQTLRYYLHPAMMALITAITSNN